MAGENCSRAIGIREQSLGKQHPDVAESLAVKRQIWNVNSSFGDHSGGLKSLALLEKKYGNSHPALIPTLLALAGDIYDRWDTKHAARAVSIAKSSHGDLHPIYGQCLTVLATAHRHNGRVEQAEELQRQSIEVVKNTLGPEHTKLGEALRNLANIEYMKGNYPQAELRFRESLRFRFNLLNDEELCRLCKLVMQHERFRSFDKSAIYDAYLIELVRRGGPVIERFLRMTLEQWRKQYVQAIRDRNQLSDDADFEKWNAIERRIRKHSRNLEVVTALRRIQKKRDPLQIFVTAPKTQDWMFPEVPVLKVTIRNVDEKRAEVEFQEWGDYRSGRQARWRVEVRDVNGRLRPPRIHFGGMSGGGIYSQTTLKFGQAWNTALRMESFVETLEPGEYSIRVLYHDHLTIVDWRFSAGLIVSSSRPFKLKVKPHRIVLTDKQRVAVRKLLNQLDGRGHPKLIEGQYGKQAHKFIKPTSPHGRLLSLGWVAVPETIAALSKQKLDSKRRAHLLGLLFSITGQHDPRPSEIFRTSGALGAYEVLTQGWSVSGNREGEGRSSGFGWTDGPSKIPGTIEVKEQTALVRRWKDFKQHLEVVSPCPLNSFPR